MRNPGDWTLSALVLVIGLSGCGGGTGPQQSAAAASAGTVQVRFVNASPDAAYQDPLDAALGAPLNSSYVSVDGTQVATLQAGPAYVSSPGFNGVPLVSSATGYITVPSTAKAITYTPSAPSPGTSGIVGPFAISQFSAGHRYTAVLAGSYCLHSLKIYTFDDGDAAQTGTVAVYHVAPDSPQNYAFGFFDPSTGPQPGAQPAGTAIPGQRIAVPAPQSAVGVYVADQSQAVIGAIVPSAIDSFDAGNTLPFNALKTLSLFISDTAQKNFGGAILCANEQFGSPNVVGALAQ